MLFENQRLQQTRTQGSIHTHFSSQIEQLDKYYDIMTTDKRNLAKCQQERNHLVYK